MGTQQGKPFVRKHHGVDLASGDFAAADANAALIRLNFPEEKDYRDASDLNEDRQTHILETVTRNIEAARFSP